MKVIYNGPRHIPFIERNSFHVSDNAGLYYQRSDIARKFFSFYNNEKLLNRLYATKDSFWVLVPTISLKTRYKCNNNLVTQTRKFDKSQALIKQLYLF